MSLRKLLFTGIFALTGCSPSVNTNIEPQTQPQRPEEQKIQFYDPPNYSDFELRFFSNNTNFNSPIEELRDRVIEKGDMQIRTDEENFNIDDVIYQTYGVTIEGVIIRYAYHERSDDRNYLESEMPLQSVTPVGELGMFFDGRTAIFSLIMQDDEPVNGYPDKISLKKQTYLPSRALDPDEIGQAGNAIVYDYLFSGLDFYKKISVVQPLSPETIPREILEQIKLNTYPILLE